MPDRTQLRRMARIALAARDAEDPRWLRLTILLHMRLKLPHAVIYRHIETLARS